MDEKNNQDALFDSTSEKCGSGAMQAKESSMNLTNGLVTSNYSTVTASEINDEEINEECATLDQVAQKSTCSYAKLTLAFFLLSLITVVIIDTLTSHYITNKFQIFLDWFSDNILAGFFAFIALYFFAAVALVPGSILTLGIGFVFGKTFGLGIGVILACCAVFVGASMGAIASFLLGRYLLRDLVENKFVEKYTFVRALDGAIQQNGLYIFLLFRLSPVIPFDVMNYIAGVTSVTFKDYALTLIAILPGTILYCFIGASAASLTESEEAMHGPAMTAFVVGGILFGVMALFIVSYYTKKEFDKIVAEEEMNHQLLENELQQKKESQSEREII